jgi:uncharacterized protein (DUF1015 family)
MATVMPLKGILYNPEKITDHADVTTPPYDVISPDEQAAFYERHPNNAIRLILNRAEASRCRQGQSPHPIGRLLPAMDLGRHSQAG